MKRRFIFINIFLTFKIEINRKTTLKTQSKLNISPEG